MVLPPNVVKLSMENVSFFVNSGGLLLSGAFASAVLAVLTDFAVKFEAELATLALHAVVVTNEKASKAQYKKAIFSFMEILV
jgi:hypothetical protein